MFAKFYANNELIDILSASSYEPKLVEICNKLNSSDVLGNYIEGKVKLGVTGSIAKDYVESGTPNAVPYITTKQVNDIIAYINGAKYINDLADKKWAKCRVNNGDIIINKSGNVGAAAILDASPYSYVNSVSDIISFSLKENSGIDKAFLVVFLNSPYGQSQLKRLSGGAIFDHVSLHAIAKLKIAVYQNKTQKYIGDKVRQAEQLRIWGKELELNIDNIFRQEVYSLGYKENPQKKYIWATLEEKLSPEFYSNKYQFFNEKWFQESSDPLGQFINNGTYGILPNSSSYGKGDVKFITASYLKKSNIAPNYYLNVPFEEVSGKARVSKGDILLEIKGNIESCELASELLDGIYINGSIFKFTPKNISPGYLCFYLRSFIKKLYCDRVGVNNIISYLDLESIHNLPVLRFDNEIEASIGNKFNKINNANRMSFQLIFSAKLLIEALIEGQITEQQIIDAQNALEAGDNSLDRDILSRVTDKGVAIEGKPLFDDLDKLYDLLQESQEAIEQKDDK